jgi:hypothetical protein
MRHSPRQWAGIRDFCEGEPPTYALASRASGISATAIRHRAAEEGWAKLDCRTRAGRKGRSGQGALAPAEPDGAAAPEGWEEMPPEARLKWLNDFVARQVARIAAFAEGEGGTLDKARIDALASMIRMLEKSSTFSQERTETQVQDDAELAEKLRLVDERVLELAEALAGRMGGGPDRGELG